MYEPRHRQILSPPRFFRRVLLHFATALTLVIASLIAGMAGYAYFENLAWRDSFLNAAMLLGGMGPVDFPHTPGGKIFAGIYALYSGLVFLITAGIIVAPLIHRLLHRFHWNSGTD